MIPDLPSQNKEDIMNVYRKSNNRYGKWHCTVLQRRDFHYALLEMTKSAHGEGKGEQRGKRKLYYISAEFLIGKLLSNNLINLGIYEEAKQVLAGRNGKNLAEIEEVGASRFSKRRSGSSGSMLPGFHSQRLD